MRGNPGYVVKYLTKAGSIPACAGEPVAADVREQRDAVYPRVCGGTADATDREFVLSGLSPRVRGNQTGVLLASGCRGSIPACAGEPTAKTLSTRVAQVYPRVCGGT